MRLFRISNILLLMLAAFFGVLLFWTSQAVQQKEDDLAILTKSLRQETEAIRVLSLEWDYLNRPERLEQLAREELGMEMPSPAQLVSTADAIPEPVPAVGYEALMQENITHEISTEQTPEKTVVPVRKPVTVSPSRAEKQSFERLIQRLDAENGGGR